VPGGSVRWLLRSAPAAQGCTEVVVSAVVAFAHGDGSAPQRDRVTPGARPDPGRNRQTENQRQDREREQWAVSFYLSDPRVNQPGHGDVQIRQQPAGVTVGHLLGTDRHQTDHRHQTSHGPEPAHGQIRPAPRLCCRYGRDRHERQHRKERRHRGESGNRVRIEAGQPIGPDRFDQVARVGHGRICEAQFRQVPLQIGDAFSCSGPAGQRHRRPSPARGTGSSRRRPGATRRRGEHDPAFRQRVAVERAFPHAGAGLSLVS